ncbi:MAG: hypothetical protein ACLQVJ_13865 [Syntrophobacteraceae bacterium]
MNHGEFLKRLFNGYVNSYATFRWHTKCSDCDMTQQELSYFYDLGIKLGFISKREHSERYPLGHRCHGANNTSNNRDLVWIDTDNHDAIFLHLERENKPDGAIEAVRGKNKLRDSARFLGKRYLVGIFGWVRADDFEQIQKIIASDTDYKGRNILIIGWVGENYDKTDRVIGLVYTNDGVWEREAKTYWDSGQFWHLAFGEAQGDQWHQLESGGLPRT